MKMSEVAALNVVNVVRFQKQSIRDKNILKGNWV